MKNKFELGLEKRKETLGAKYVEENLALADTFTKPFQEAMTEWCWGFGWGDETIDKKTRSMMNLARFIIDLVFLSMVSSPHPNPQHHSVIAS